METFTIFIGKLDENQLGRDNIKTENVTWLSLLLVYILLVVLIYVLQKYCELFSIR